MSDAAAPYAALAATLDRPVAPRAAFAPTGAGPRRLGAVRLSILAALAFPGGMLGAWAVLPAADGTVILRDIQSTSGVLPVATAQPVPATARVPEIAPVRVAHPGHAAGEVPTRWHRWRPLGRSVAAWRADLDAALLRAPEALRGDADRMADVLRGLRASRSPGDAEVMAWVADEAALLLATLERLHAAPPRREADLAGLLALIEVERSE